MGFKWRYFLRRKGHTLEQWLNENNIKNLVEFKRRVKQLDVVVDSEVLEEVKRHFRSKTKSQASKKKTSKKRTSKASIKEKLQSAILSEPNNL